MSLNLENGFRLLFKEFSRIRVMKVGHFVAPFGSKTNFTSFHSDDYLSIYLIVELSLLNKIADL